MGDPELSISLKKIDKIDIHAFPSLLKILSLTKKNFLCNPPKYQLSFNWYFNKISYGFSLTINIIKFESSINGRIILQIMKA